MSTYVGTISEHECEFDSKVFEDPKPECIREGVWTRDKKCSCELLKNKLS